MKIVSAKTMARLDEETIKRHNISAEVLMARAGRSVSDCVMDTIKKNKLVPSVVLFAGKGNNGGDAFVAARFLHKAGIQPTTILLTNEKSLASEALLNFSRLKEAGGDIFPALSINDLKPLESRLQDCSIIVDGILGTGIRGEVTGFFADVIKFINSLEKFVVAIDIPSGMNGNDGILDGVCVNANVTVTMGLPKQGFFEKKSLNYLGKLTVADIGIPNELIEYAESHADLITKKDVQVLFPKRKRISHKGDYGRLMALCGSRGYTGAGCLVTQAAMRCGTGLAYLMVPESLNAAMEAKLTEVITIPIPETSAGTPAYKALDIVLEKLSQCNVAVVGSGISINPDTARLVRGVLMNSNAPLVLDADGINCISKEKTLLKNYKGDCIITPHIGEFARLTGSTNEEVLENPCSMASEFAKEYGITVVLKSAQTVVASHDGKVFVNITGNAGMATAGTGDVLTGIIASLVGQGLSPLDAACLGVFLHGTAGDIAADKYGEASLIASDLIDSLPVAIKNIIR
jgi:ADP-dependent NAD(P)H-hydrate dehydratase / NAD(P)H-hydrate epimerase